MRILITGTTGQLGYELLRTLRALPNQRLNGNRSAFTLLAPDRQQLDLSQPDQITALCRDYQPQLILNPAAYTAVDRAESESTLAYAINAKAPEILAEEAKRLDALLIHYSTDYVFDGKADRPYHENDATNPLNVYGQSKRAGEEAILSTDAHALILRTSWVYARRGKNFLLTMQKLANERDELRIVNDQFGCPNWARTLAESTILICRNHSLADLTERTGIYHFTSSEHTSWFGFAEAILRSHSRKITLTPIKTEEYPLPAARPRYTVLNTQRWYDAFKFRLPAWQESLERALQEPAD